MVPDRAVYLHRKKTLVPGQSPILFESISELFKDIYPLHQLIKELLFLMDLKLASVPFGWLSFF